MVSERERAICYIRGRVFGCFDTQTFDTGKRAEAFLSALERMTDEEYRENFIFCSCCNQQESQSCQHLT